MKNLVCWLALAASIAAAQPAPSPPASAPRIIDPLGRETPRGTVLGFIRATQYGKLQIASRFLQLTDAERDKNGARLASELHAVLDQGLPSSFDLISPKPEGNIEDGIPPDRERAATISLPEGVYDLLLSRVNDPQYGPIWLVAPETIKLIPEMHQQVASPWLEEHLPRPLQTPIGGVSLWIWIAPLVVALVSGLFLYILWVLILYVVRLRTGHTNGSRWWSVSIGPLFIVFVTTLTSFALRRVGVPALHRYYYGRILGVIAWLALGRFLWHAVDWSVAHSRSQLIARLGIGATSVLQLGQGIVKILLITVVALAIFSFLGFNVTAALAGVGIGGIAIALAAQKTLENLIGGVNILSDQVLHLGDSCKLGDRQGTVEDISLRSTRIRTLEGTLLAIPNGALATMNIENFTDRRTFLFRSVVGVRYETTSQQLQATLDGIRKVLNEHPQVERDTFRVRLLEFAASSINIEVNLMIRAPNFADYAKAREEIMFGIMNVVAAAGTTFAFPSQTLYLGKDGWPLEASSGDGV